MRTLTIFLSFIAVFGCFSLANAQGIDSTQWPFPDTLGFMSDLHGTILDTPDQFDNPRDKIPEPYFANPTPKNFTWRDAVVDSNEWYFQADGQLAENNLIALDITIDTMRRQISSWHYHHSIEDMFSIEGMSDIVLTDINYSHSAIWFPDNDRYRHLKSLSSSYDGGHSDARWYYTLIELDSLSIWGQTLITAFHALDSVYFGLPQIGESEDSVLVLKNISNVPISITGYRLLNPDSGFTLIDTTLHTIPAMDSGTITVSFAPHQLKSYSDGITISTDEPYASSYKISLTGTVAMSRVSTSKTVLNDLSIMPTVADGYINVQLPSGDGSLAICNILGQQLYSKNAPAGLNSNILSIDTYSWPDGTYIATFADKMGSAAMKFIVRH